MDWIEALAQFKELVAVIEPLLGVLVGALIAGHFQRKNNHEAWRVQQLSEHGARLLQNLHDGMVRTEKILGIPDPLDDDRPPDLYSGADKWEDSAEEILATREFIEVSIVALITTLQMNAVDRKELMELVNEYASVCSTTYGRNAMYGKTEKILKNIHQVILRSLQNKK